MQQMSRLPEFKINLPHSKAAYNPKYDGQVVRRVPEIV